MAIVRFFIFLNLISACAFGQVIQTTPLTDSLEEVSGMVSKGDYIWMINDSGNEPFLYEYKGVHYQGAYYIEAQNRDWEAMTVDPVGNIYIGDIGNNANDRRERRIYRIRYADLDHSFDTIRPELREYYTPTAPPFAEGKRDYDWESLIWYAGQFHVFSKNRREPFDGNLVHFAASARFNQPDTFQIQDSTKLGAIVRELYWITDATLSEDRRHLFLLSSDKVIAYFDFPEDRFFEGYKVIMPLGSLSQHEAITAWNDTLLLIADEQTPLGGRNLKVFDYSDELEDYEEERRKEVSLDTKRIDSTITITVEPIVTTKVVLEIYNDGGLLVKDILLGEAPADSVSTFTVNLKELPVGMYILNVLCGRVPHGFFAIRPGVYDPGNQSNE
ncbi:T9SS type A sorting domain-containing protein [Phaeocystidibacter luteus]|uniref:T9SS type A sorting domain-containing protein n=1 Tax=Phaeocystidibacter luteus TaxID=911197 RepID=A0A6N6RHG3_9FLAO|nr:hypothetical protein [Phaeocystidibacter luteus]KAB2809759.1 hypothetical protein F8C67_09380 [Phaeocystidibacter luteus]